jgi:hypothetical protein
MSMLLEAHYSKGRILEAYVNDVFLGQQGDQAVHGFAAASEFYFGRRMEDLRPQEIALLVGMVKGPSYYDPRRSPDRALTRRNLVLQEFANTGLLSAAQLNAAQATPLDVVNNGQLPHNRFPAFMQLVRTQITERLRRAVPEPGQSVGIHHARSGRPAVHRAGDHQRHEKSRQACRHAAGGSGGDQCADRQRAGRGRQQDSGRPRLQSRARCAPSGWFD